MKINLLDVKERKARETGQNNRQHRALWVEGNNFMT